MTTKYIIIHVEGQIGGRVEWKGKIHLFMPTEENSIHKNVEVDGRHNVSLMYTTKSPKCLTKETKLLRDQLITLPNGFDQMQNARSDAILAKDFQSPTMMNRVIRLLQV